MKFETIKRNWKLIIIEGLVILLSITIFVTMAYFSTGDKQTQANSFSSGCLNITMEKEGSSINLTNTLPLTDVEGLSNEPYTFTIKNNCSKPSNYGIYLENLNETTNTLSSDYVKVALSSDTSDNIISILSDNKIARTTITGAYESFSIYEGTIEANATKSFSLREWMDYDTTKEQGASKTFTNKINVIADSNLVVTSSPEIKTSYNNKVLTGTITGTASSASYCVTRDHACTPNQSTTISNNQISINIEENENKQIVCTNINNKITCSDVLDTKVPTIMYTAKETTTGNNGWYTKYVMTLKASDIDNNIETFKYCITSNETCTPNTEISTNNTKIIEYDYTFETSNEAQRICSQSKDTAGNTSEIICSEAYKVDTTKPELTITASVTDKTINISATASDVGSNIASYYYSTNGGTSYTKSTESTYSLTTVVGTYNINVYVEDEAGNISEVKTTSVEIKNLAKDVILANMTTITTRSSFSGVVSGSSTGKIYKADDNDGTSYYFAGAPTDNWVKFAGFYWRIVRINGDNTIRMIYQGTSITSTGENSQISVGAYNPSSNNNMYVGYMYKSGSVHGYGTSSKIKTSLDSWYDSNLVSYESKIDTNAGFCNDRQPSSSESTLDGSGGTSSSRTYYAAYVRLVTNKAPTLKCNITSDLFTPNNSTKGNKKLSKPIGLITADEVAFAGGKDSGSELNISYYLNTNEYYWTMTPSLYNSDANVFMVYAGGYLNDTDQVTNTYGGVRPVINLRADVNLSGAGTTGNPYVVN